MSCDILVQKCFQKKQTAVHSGEIIFNTKDKKIWIKSNKPFFYFHRQHLNNAIQGTCHRLYDSCMHLGSAKIKTQTIKIPSLGIFNVTECQ